MSTPKQALNPRIKISKTGRPYVDISDLVKTELDRIEKSQERAKNSTVSDHENSNGSTTSTNGNSSNSCER